MPSFSTEVNHKLGQQEAVERLKALIEKMRANYHDVVSSLEGNWEEHRLSYTFVTYGLTIKGMLVVEETLARNDVQVPFAALVFRGTIEQRLRAELEKALG